MGSAVHCDTYNQIRWTYLCYPCICQVNYDAPYSGARGWKKRRMLPFRVGYVLPVNRLRIFRHVMCHSLHGLRSLRGLRRRAASIYTDHFLSDRTSIAITLPAYGTQSHLAISLLLNMIIGRDIRRGFPPLCTYTRTAL